MIQIRESQVPATFIIVVTTIKAITVATTSSVITSKLAIQA